MVYTKQKIISEIKSGDIIETDIFVIKIKKNATKYKNGFYFSLILTDESGLSLEWNYWGGESEEEVSKIANNFKSDDIVLIKKGIVSDYNGKLQINCKDPEKDIQVLNPEEYEADFIPSTDKDIEEMFKKLQEKIALIEDTKLREFVENIFKEPGIENKFKQHPAAITFHHNFKGGLLEHTLDVISYCEKSFELYPTLDKDLLLVSAILHDIGKLEELEMTKRIKGSTKGQLLGHITLGALFLNERFKDSGLDELLKNKILHIVLASHGKLEFGSPKEPMLKEAIALYYADELSSKLNEVTELIEENREKTGDDFIYIPKKYFGKNILLR